MPDIVSVLWRLFSAQWNGLPVASLVVLAIDGLMCLTIGRMPRRRPHLEHWLCADLAGLPVTERVAALRIRAAEWVWATSRPSARCT